MNPSYRFESLSDSIKVCVSPEHRFGTDAFLLANFAAPRHKDIVCDLGTGCGIIPMALAKKLPAKTNCRCRHSAASDRTVSAFHRTFRFGRKYYGNTC